MLKKLRGYLLILAIAIVFLIVCAVWGEFLEGIYLPFQSHVYDYMGRLVTLTPFSLFEFLIMGLVLCFLYALVRMTLAVVRGNLRDCARKMGIAAIKIICVLLTVFIFGFGVNYYRSPLERTFDLERKELTPAQLEELGKYLLHKVNDSRKEVNEDVFGVFRLRKGIDSTLLEAHRGYDSLSTVYDKLPAGRFSCPKQIVLSSLMSYSYIVGIYSPFTGEANVNIHVPPSSIPFSALHEMAHQRGIAGEQDANFVAFLAALSHPNPDFVYSGYYAMYSYTLNKLFESNPGAAKKLMEGFSLGVLADTHYRRKYWEQYTGAFGDFSDRLNDAYLRLNNQDEGAESYGLVVELLYAYLLEKGELLSACSPHGAQYLCR